MRYTPSLGGLVKILPGISSLSTLLDALLNGTGTWRSASNDSTVSSTDAQLPVSYTVGAGKAAIVFSTESAIAVNNVGSAGDYAQVYSILTPSSGAGKYIGFIEYLAGTRSFHPISVVMPAFIMHTGDKLESGYNVVVSSGSFITHVSQNIYEWTP